MNLTNFAQLSLREYLVWVWINDIRIFFLGNILFHTKNNRKIRTKQQTLFTSYRSSNNRDYKNTNSLFY